MNSTTEQITHSVPGDKPKTIIVHRYFWPENVAVLPLMLKEVVQLHLDKGHEVMVVCGASSDYSKEWDSAFDGQVEFSCFSSNIDRQGTKLFRVKNSIKLASLAIKKIMTSGDVKIVYLVSYPPLFAGLILTVVSLFKRSTKCIYYLQDNHTYLIKKRWVRSAFDAYNRYVVKRSAAVITLSNSMREGLAECFKSSEREQMRDKIHVVENYSTDLAFASNDEIHKDYDIVYAGNHGVAQNLYFFFDLVKEIKSDAPLKIKFYGDGTEKQKLIKYCSDIGVPVDFNDPLSREKISEQIARARFGLVAAQPELTKYAHPSKLAAYNSAGTKAIVMCESDSALADWLVVNDMGVSIDPVDSKQAASELAEVFRNNSDSYSTQGLLERSRQLYGKEAYLDKLEKNYRLFSERIKK